MVKVQKITPVSLNKKQVVEYAALAAQQLGQAVTGAKFLGGGSYGRAVGITLSGGEKIVVKLLLIDDMLEKETAELALLRQYCTAKIPRVLFSREKDAQIPVDCYAMERIGGKDAFLSLNMLFLPKSKRLEFAQEVTRALHAVHECKSSKFGDSTAPDCDSWTDYYKPFAKEILERACALYAQKRLSRRIMHALQAMWNQFDIIFSEEVKDACLTHGDLNVANIMVDRRGRVTGFIDPLLSMYADREYDLFQLDNLTGKHFFLRKTYTSEYGQSKYCEQKLAFYALYNEVFSYIRTGSYHRVVMNPILRNVERQLKTL